MNIMYNKTVKFIVQLRHVGYATQ